MPKLSKIIAALIVTVVATAWFVAWRACSREPRSPRTHAAAMTAPLSAVLPAEPATHERRLPPDSIVVFARHTEARFDDPVKVQFTSFKVTKATFDPAKIEGGKATIEIAAGALESGHEKRDAHIKSLDFFDITRFPTITIDIDKVKHKAEAAYTAEATVAFRNITRRYPVTFDVVDRTADSIRIEGEARFSRLDFKIGKNSTNPREAPVQNDLVIQMNLTLKKT